MPHIGKNERNYVAEAFDQNWMSTVGENINQLEIDFEKYTTTNAAAVSSGTAGIHLGLKLLDIKEGDEVVCQSLTFVAGANPILYEKAKPIFLDSDYESWNMDPNILADFLKKRAVKNKLPKLITITHLFGQPAKLDDIIEICNKYELPLLEDAAESLGARYKGKLTGTFGDVGVFSLNGNKIITATSGGIIVSKDISIIKKAKKISSQSKEIDPKGLGNFLHSEIGYNYRMSNVLAGIARGQLEILELRVNQRRNIFNKYEEQLINLAGIKPQNELKNCKHSRWLSCFIIDQKEFGFNAHTIIKILKNHNIESRPVWKPLHTQKLFKKYEKINGNVSESLNNMGICLPSSSSITETEQMYIIKLIIDIHINKEKYASYI